MKKENWIWMPHAAHFILGHRCNFRLATYVGGYIVSTVGELHHSEQQLEDRKFDNVNCDSLYETMVFRARKNDRDCGCPYIQDDNYLTELDVIRYNSPEEARLGHIGMCEKWSKKDA